MKTTLLALAATALLGGCTTPEEKHGSTCQQHGFSPGTSEYSQCVRHLEAMRQHFGEDALR